MLGAIIGDIVGSRFEWNNHRSKDFEFLTYKCFPTDDSIMSLAIAQAILVSKKDYSDLSKNAIECMQNVGRNYPNCGYGGSFYGWIFSDDPKPYNSYGNGAAMRVSAAGFAANSIEEAKKLSRLVTEVSHNHPEGIKGAEATVVAIFMAKTGSNIFEIRDYIDKNYYPMNFTLDEIRDTYHFNETCQETVPQALQAFFESTGFEDAIRNAISIGGDSDTVAAICGGVAEAYYGIPTDIRKHALTFLDQKLMQLLILFENKYPPVMEKMHDDMSVRIKRSEDKKVKTGCRESMIQSATETADQELKDSIPENEETTSQKLFAHLYEACNILRGPINQDEFKDYVTPILFFKRISDVYDEETQEALELSGGDEEFAAFDENHSFVIPEGCHWKDLRNASQDVGKIIVKAMNGIERANPGTLIPWMSSGEVHMGRVTSTEKKISQLGYDKCSTKMVPLHTVVIALAGQGKTRGTVAVTEIELCTNQSLCAMVTDETVLSDYLYHNLRNRYEEIRNMCAIADGRGGLNLKIVGSIKVIVPSIEEQQQFVAFAEQSDKSKFALQEAIKDLDALTKKIIAENLIPAGKE